MTPPTNNWLGNALLYAHLHFADGRRPRDEAADGLFAIAVEPTARACELLVLGQTDRVLRRVDLTEAKRGSSGVAQPGECERM
jgi:hypothetical protein